MNTETNYLWGVKKYLEMTQQINFNVDVENDKLSYVCYDEDSRMMVETSATLDQVAELCRFSSWETLQEAVERYEALQDEASFEMRSAMV